MTVYLPIHTAEPAFVSCPLFGGNLATSYGEHRLNCHIDGVLIRVLSCFFSHFGYLNTKSALLPLCRIPITKSAIKSCGNSSPHVRMWDAFMNREWL